MTKIIFLLLSLFFISNNIFGKPPGKEQNPDWPCIQVLVKELSWGSIWTGPPLDENSSKWSDNENLKVLAKKLMNRRTKENEGIFELKNYIKKNNSPNELTELFHSLFDTTNDIWRNRVTKLLNFGKKQRLTSEKISLKLEKIKELSKDFNTNKDEIEKLEQEQFWDIRRFEDRRNLSDSLCEQPRFYEKRLGVYSTIILENIN
tara:strand:+ start:813 stop:1424 length:612 start_codon:yes stop_codon:yes gene_type:complete